MATHKPQAVLIGFIGKFPVAGMALYNLHYIVGLQELGYEVHYVERQNRPQECYDPSIDQFTDNPGYALGYLEQVLSRVGIPPDRYSFIDRENHCYGVDWDGLRTALDHAEFVLTLSDKTWFDELARCPQRAFVDGDPLFTQVAMLEGEPVVSTALEHYDLLFTYGVRMGKADCTIPAADRKWIPTRPVVATSLWEPAPAVGPLPLTTVMNWAAWQDVTHKGVAYGHKNREFERFIDLPRQTMHRFVLAAGGPAPKERLHAHDWQLVNPLDKTGTIESYQAFIADSLADFGIAKHAYVASRSGWFSDRSTCYLAAGRPVLHQETGFSDWLPPGEGIFPFSTVDDVLVALEDLDANYERHAEAARRIAEEHFEASTVIGRMLDEAGFR
jgi:hypothetical protein